MTSQGSSIGDLVAAKFGDAQAVQLDFPDAVMAELVFPGVDEGVVIDNVYRAIPELFDVSLTEVLVGSWSKLDEIRDFRGPDGGQGEVALAEHDVEADYRPVLTVRVDQAPPRSIELDLRLTIGLTGVVLRIAGGKIREVVAGEVRLSAGLVWRDREIMTPLRTEPILLGPCLHLGDGLDIP